MLSTDQLKIVDFYNVKKLLPNFLINKSMCFIIENYNFI